MNPFTHQTPAMGREWGNTLKCEPVENEAHARQR